jgi:DNA-binding GntR family transcriptional regulator
VLESYAARLATLRHNKKDLQALAKKVQQYEEALERKDFDALRDAERDSRIPQRFGF